MQDTTATQARKGRDIQGIPWERLSITREKYRQTRLEQYKNYENIPKSGEGSEKVDSLFCCTSCLFCSSLVSFAFLISLAIACTNRTANPLKKEACIMSSEGIQDL